MSLRAIGGLGVLREPCLPPVKQRPSLLGPLLPAGGLPLLPQALLTAPGEEAVLNSLSAGRVGACFPEGLVSFVVPPCGMLGTPGCKLHTGCRHEPGGLFTDTPFPCPAPLALGS